MPEELISPEPLSPKPPDELRLGLRKAMTFLGWLALLLLLGLAGGAYWSQLIFFRPTVQPRPKLDAPSQRVSIPTENIPSLVEQLDSDCWSNRDQASQKLIQIGKPALPYLQKALTHSSAEVVWRAEAIIAEIENREKEAVE